MRGTSCQLFFFNIRDGKWSKINNSEAEKMEISKDNPLMIVFHATGNFSVFDGDSDDFLKKQWQGSHLPDQYWLDKIKKTGQYMSFPIAEFVFGLEEHQLFENHSNDLCQSTVRIYENASELHSLDKIVKKIYGKGDNLVQTNLGVNFQVHSSTCLIALESIFDFTRALQKASQKQFWINNAAAFFYFPGRCFQAAVNLARKVAGSSPASN